MRKILIFVALLFVLLWGYLFAFKGVNSIYTVYNMADIDAKQTEVTDKITEIKNLQNEDLATKTAKLNSSVKTYKETKEKYDDLLKSASTEQKQEAALGNYYDIEYLWTKLGVYSTKYGTDIALKVSKSELGNKLLLDYQMCDLTFTVEGTYKNVIDYMYAMEDDSDLNFTISKFKMTPSSKVVEEKNGNTTTKKTVTKVVGEFTVENVPVSANGLTGLESATAEENKENADGTKKDSGSNTNTTNTTNTTNNTTSNTTSNTTNSTSTNTTNTVSNNTTN